MDPETYMTDRVDTALHYYEQAANRAKRAHVAIQTAIITLGILVPVIVNLPAQWGEGLDIGPDIRILVTVLSLTLALLTGIANFRKYGDLWLTYRMTEELLKTEKFLFLTGSGKYVEAEDRFPLFVQSTEEIISSEHIKFRTIVEESRRPSKKES